MKFLESVSSFWEKGATFTGTASRSEYWWAQLFIFGCIFLIYFFAKPENQDSMVFLFENVIVFVPSMALTVRRFNDIKLPIWIPIVLLLLAEVFRFGDIAVSDSETTKNYFMYFSSLLEFFVMGTCLAPTINGNKKD